MVGENSLKIENLVATAGIGCHGKISDYLNVNTFNSLHGRAVASAQGIKAGNPDLNVVVFTGDGDSFSEGLNHLLHAAQNNTDIAVFLHKNDVFGLTTGQATPLSPKGFKGPTTPTGSIDEPMNPLEIVLASGATFVARTYAGDMAETTRIMKAAMTHKGFAFVEIIQPCITYFDTREHFKNAVEHMPAETQATNDLGAALAKVREQSEKIPLGIFYQTQKPTFEEQVV